MLEASIRPHLQKHFFNPLARVISTFLSANSVTLLALIMGGFSALLIVLNHPILAVIFLCISGLLDILDGSIARLQNTSSSLGTIYDIVADRIVELLIVIGLYAYSPENRGWEAIGILGSSYICVTTFLVVGLFTPNTTEKSFHYSPGLIERTEAFGFFVLMILLPNLFSLLAITYTVLVMYTSIRRLYEFRKHPA